MSYLLKSKVKNKTQTRREYFISDEGLVSIIYKELLKLNSKTTQKTGERAEQTPHQRRYSHRKISI